MAKPVKFIPKQTPDGWRINIPAKFSQSGKRERHFYPNRAKAEAAAKALRGSREAFGTQAIGISPSLAEMAVAAATLLEPHGLTIMDAAVLAVEASNKRLKSSELSTALDLFLASKEGKSSSYLRACRYMKRDLTAEFSGRFLSSIEGDELLDHVSARTNGESAFNTRARIISSFWNWSARPPREWCDLKPLKFLEQKEEGGGAIGILSVAECKAVLSAAETYHPDAVMAFATMLFTGIRKEELERLEPSDFTEDGISIPAAKAKTKRRRFIHMPPSLAAWLRAYPIGETVCPTNWPRKYRAVRRLSGWRVWCDLFDPPEPPRDLPEWPHNALRHTAATMALALGKPLETLVFEHGHVGDLTLLRTHYIGQMSKRAALDISRILPHSATR